LQLPSCGRGCFCCWLTRHVGVAVVAVWDNNVGWKCRHQTNEPRDFDIGKTPVCEADELRKYVSIIQVGLFGFVCATAAFAADSAAFLLLLHTQIEQFQSTTPTSS